MTFSQFPVLLVLSWFPDTMTHAARYNYCDHDLHSFILVPPLLLAGQVLSRLTGHTDRLARIAFHPMGRHLVRICPAFVGLSQRICGRALQYWQRHSPESCEPSPPVQITHQASCPSILVEAASPMPLPSPLPPLRLPLVRPPPAMT